MADKPTAEIIKDHVVAAGAGTFAATSGWGVFIGTEPDAPNTTITVYDTGGFSPQGYHDRTVPKLQRATVQIRVRGTGYLETYAKLEVVVEYLNGLGKALLDSNSQRFWSYVQVDEPLALPRDEKNRFIFVVNYEVLKERVPTP